MSPQLCSYPVMFYALQTTDLVLWQIISKPTYRLDTYWTFLAKQHFCATFSFSSTLFSLSSIRAPCSTDHSYAVVQGQTDPAGFVRLAFSGQHQNTVIARGSRLNGYQRDTCCRDNQLYISRTLTSTINLTVGETTESVFPSLPENRSRTPCAIYECLLDQRSEPTRCRCCSAQTHMLQGSIILLLKIWFSHYCCLYSSLTPGHVLSLSLYKTYVLIFFVISFI